MAYFLPSGSDTNSETDLRTTPEQGAQVEEMADLKIFWGPEICRLEYLVHLLETGRIKDEYWRRSA